MDHVDLWLPANLVAAFRAHCAQVGVPFEEAVRLLMQHELKDAESSIIPSPTTGSAPTPDRRDRYRRFWDALLHHLRRNRVPLPQNWFSFPLGRAGFTVDIVWAAGYRLRACCVIRTPTRSVNEQIFHDWHGRRAAIEAEWGGPLRWEERPGHLACRICDETSGSIFAEDKWPELIEWIAGRLDRFERIFGSLVQEAAEAYAPNNRIP